MPEASSPETFQAAESFQGARPGYVFKVDKHGLGYYLDPVQVNRSIWDDVVSKLPETWRETPHREEQLRVSEQQSCGLSMSHSDFGFVVDKVEDEPGQKLQKGEAIVAIEGRLLAGLSAPQMQASFQKRRVDGARLYVVDLAKAEELSRRDPNIIEMWDPVKQHNYYFHKKTGKSAWTLEELQPAPSTSTSASSEKRKAEAPSQAPIDIAHFMQHGIFPGSLDVAGRGSKGDVLELGQPEVAPCSTSCTALVGQLVSGCRPVVPSSHTGPRSRRSLVARRHLEGSLAAIPGPAAKKAVRTLTVRWTKVVLLLVVQYRLVPRVCTAVRRLWRHLSAKKLKLLSADEIYSLKEALEEGPVLQSDLELESAKILEGTKVLNSWKEIQGAEPPLTVRTRPPPDKSERRGWMSSRQWKHWKRIWDISLEVLRRAQGPLLMWGWSTLALQALQDPLLDMWSRREFAFYRAAFGKLQVIPSWTAVAWFSHRLVRLWGNRRSRGRAELSDVMGVQSSLQEARINAMATALKVLVWSIYICAVLYHAGVRIGRLLLIPGTTAVVIGWVGREIVANMISGVVLHLTQPFAQGDWVCLDGTSIDGWVQDVGSFYTKVVQWDKRPIYVPNYKLMSMNVQNNSRMTHRRIKYDLNLRLRDIPNIPQIVRDMQEMINEHEDIDNIQHRLVRWRGLGEYSATIWLSCYTKPSIEGIRLASYTAIQQSVLERCSQIVYKHDAAFASITDRNPQAGGTRAVPFGQIFSEPFSSARESQLESREEVLRQREKDIKQRERELSQEQEEQAKAAKDIQHAKEKQKQLLEQVIQKSMDVRTGQALPEDVDPMVYGVAAAQWDKAAEEEMLDYSSGDHDRDVVESQHKELADAEVQHDSMEAEGEHRTLADALEAAEVELRAVEEAAQQKDEQEEGAADHASADDERPDRREAHETEEAQQDLAEAEAMRIPVKEMGGYTQQFFDRYKNCRAFEPKPKEDKRLKGWRARPRTDRGLVGILFLKASKRRLIDFVCLRYLTLQCIAAEGPLNSDKMMRCRQEC
ncbi:ynaI [Symbiodinium sp. CCMP2592]|nr:ynaI [Symbiodinium sp. CCMP2592]